MNIPGYPDILKSQNWQKEKSIIAKALPGKNTGISKAMEECQTQHEVMRRLYSYLTDAKKIPQEALREANSYLQHIRYVQTAAQQAAAGWSSKLCPVPASTRKHAEAIANAARNHYVAVKAVSGLK